MIKISQYKKPLLLLIMAIICIISMGYLADFTWQIIETDEAISPPKNQQSHPKKQTTLPPITVNTDLRDILSSNLFNQRKAIAKIEPTQKKIPKTRQQLFLHGIISSSDPERSIALISKQKNKPPLVYLQGDKLPSNSGTVHLILNAYVQIKHNGRLEKLELMKAKNTKPLKRGAINRATIPKKPASLSEIKRDYKKNKQQLFSKFGLISTKNGVKLTSKKGRLPPGLRDGDTITSLNGYSMNDLDNDLDLVDSIINSDKIEASLERNGRDIHFNIPKKMIEAMGLNKH